MIWAFFGVVALIAGVLCYLGARSWPAWHVVVLFFLLVSMAGLLVLASMALKTHKEWRMEHAQLEQQVLAAERSISELRDSNSLLSDEAALNSLPGVTEALSETVIDRGRVWRNVSPTEIQAAQVSLDMSNWGDRRCARVGLGDDEELEPEPDPTVEGEGEAEAAPAVAAATHQLSVSMIVYAFVEKPITELDETRRSALFGEQSSLVENDTAGVCKLPSTYVGDYRVTAVDNNQVVIVPLSPPDEFHQQALSDSQGKTWTLYELMPLDSHQVFPVAGSSVVDDEDEDDDEADGGASDPLQARRELLMALMPQASMPGLAQEDYERLIDRYVRDRTRAAAGDPPTETLTHVRFLQEHSIDVDLEAADPGAESSYDPSGRAQLPHLRHGTAVTYQQGDEQYFDTETAERLVREGHAEVTDEPPLYSRPLVDYVLFFQQNQMQLDRLAIQIATLTADSRDVMLAAEKADAQIAYRTAEKTKLESDRENLQREMSSLNTLLAELREERSVQKTEIANLFRMNRQLENQLREAGFDAATVPVSHR